MASTGREAMKNADEVAGSCLTRHEPGGDRLVYAPVASAFEDERARQVDVVRMAGPVRRGNGSAVDDEGYAQLMAGSVGPEGGWQVFERLVERAEDGVAVSEDDEVSD